MPAMSIRPRMLKAAREIGVSERTMRRLIRSSQIRAYTLGRRVLVDSARRSFALLLSTSDKPISL
jgi:excisionase family DNA binding protein